MTDTTSRSQRSRPGLLVLLTFVLAPALILLVVVSVSALRTQHLIVEVPLGTTARIEAGERVELLPRSLEVEVGDTLEIRNADVETHIVGPYTVAAGQTVRQTFASPGTVQGLCTLHPDGELTIVVR